MADKRTVIEWLLDAEGSDPSIRWQVGRDLLDLPEPEWAAERARVENEGWGARLLALEDEDGLWAGGAHFPADYGWGSDEPGQPWTSTSHSLTQLRELGLVPSARTERMVSLIGEHARWEHEAQPYWEGEVEPCINGQLVANGTYFGVDMTPVVERLLAERLEDGGWNCEAERGSVRSSFHTTINVLEGLLEFERAGRGTPESVAARRSGEEYLLVRSLYRRLSTGEPADERMLALIHPSRWFYHVLRALDYFRSAGLLTGARPDPRLAEGIEIVRSRRLEDGRWPLDWVPTGRSWFEVDDGAEQPSRWITLQAQRVLRWWEAKPIQWCSRRLVRLDPDSSYPAVALRGPIRPRRLAAAWPRPAQPARCYSPSPRCSPPSVHGPVRPRRLAAAWPRLSDKSWISSRRETVSMPYRERHRDRGSRRARTLLAELGRELREARHAAGLRQVDVARAADVSASWVSLVERGLAAEAGLRGLSVMLAVVGLDLRARAYPGASPLRDEGHRKVLRRTRHLLPTGSPWQAEVPFPQVGDPRAWDAVTRLWDLRVGIEAELRPSDLQSLQRRLEMKLRDGGADRLILVLANTRHNRDLLRLAAQELRAMFPLQGRAALAALRSERDPGCNLLLLV